MVMHSLAAVANPDEPRKDLVRRIATEARARLPDDSTTAKMFDFVWERQAAGDRWEQARDAVYLRYQVEQQDGYDVTSRDLYCNGCFASGINFAASIVSLLYGEGDYRETVKIAVLAGWDSDNPASTWGGLLGFLEGRSGLERLFERAFSEHFNIHRTRGGFPNDGLDTFPDMASKGILVVDRTVVERMNGRIDEAADAWRFE